MKTTPYRNVGLALSLGLLLALAICFAMTTPTLALPYHPQGAWPDVVITQTTTWVSSSVQLNSLVITNGATLILSGTTVITANNVTVAQGASVLADGQGYTGTTVGQGNGPGGGQGATCSNCGGGGGGYGGDGGNGYSRNGGPAYGSLYEPSQLGSAGGTGEGYGPQPGGNGGGAIRLVISDTLRIDGVLSANGISGTYRSGGGSGGSIWATAHTISGTGVIRANGGAGGNYDSPPRGGGGAGGRIALYASANVFSGTIRADGGTGYRAGQHGTIYDGIVDPISSTLTIWPQQNVGVKSDTTTLTVSLVTTGGLAVASRPVWVHLITGTSLIVNGTEILDSATAASQCGPNVICNPEQWQYIGDTDSNGAATAVLSSTLANQKIIEARCGWVYVSNTASIIFVQANR